MEYIDIVYLKEKEIKIIDVLCPQPEGLLAIIGHCEKGCPFSNVAKYEVSLIH